MNKPLVIVTPVYEDLEACSKLVEQLAAEFGNDFFLVIVDDGSVKQPLQIDILNRHRVSGVVLKLKRNVGHQRAIAIGLAYVSTHVNDVQRVVVMDSDGEDVPSSIKSLLAHLDSSEIDVVVAQRKSRVETIQFKLFYQIYKRFFWLMTGRTISFGNFMAMKANAVKRLVVMQELSIHVAGAVLASKLRTQTCPLDRGARYAGQSKMNFVGLVLHGFKGLMVFAEDVLVRVGIACAGIASFAIFGAFTASILKFFGYSTPGWFSIALGIMVMMFLQTGTLALMTLMLTGVVRGGTVATVVGYESFIEAVIPASSALE